MGIMSWIGFGLLAGVLAKMLLPGNDGSGFIRTVLLGIAGSFLGGFVGSFFGMGTAAEWSMPGIATAVGGALIFLVINRLLSRPYRK